MGQSRITAPEQAITCPYTVNKRYLHVETGLPLTVRYIGPLPPSSTADNDSSNNATTWIGVEWDDSSRGKHSGIYRDIQVFHTRVAGAGSFLKFKPTIRHGHSSISNSSSGLPGGRGVQLLDPGIGLFQAIYERYISSNDASTSETPVDKIVLGSSNGHILVEMPNIDKVVQRLRKGLEPALDNQTRQSGGEAACLGIKEVGLEGEWVHGVEEWTLDCRNDPEHRSDIRQWMILKGKLTNVNSLNLSRNLIPSWRELAAVCAELPNLKTLIVNCSRLEPLCQPLVESLPANLKGCFDKVEELHICKSLISWQDVIFFSSGFPVMRTLDVAGNPLLNVHTSDVRHQSEVSSVTLGRMESLDVSGCSLKSWADVESLLSQTPSLHSLNLSENPLPSIGIGSSSDHPSPLPPIHTLILKATQVREWQSIDNLNIILGATLRTFKYSLAGDPQEELQQHSQEDPRHPKSFQGRSDDRVFLIAKLGGLETLSGTPITKQERADAERFYLTQAVKVLGPDAQDVPGWGRLKELKAKHGVSDVVSVQTSAHVTLKSKMIDINVEAPDLGVEAFSINILPMAPMKLLKTKIARHLGVPLNSEFTFAVREAGHGEIRELEVNERANVASLELMDQDTVLVGIK